MRIAQLATNVERVPPAGYGGTELIVSHLTEELLRRGHEVTLFATADSITDAALVSVTDKPLRSDPTQPPTRWQAFDIRLLLKLQEMQSQFDIVHNHMGWQALPILSNLSCPVVSTNHNPVKPYAEDIYLSYRRLPYVAISQAYQKLNFPAQLNYVKVIYNGIKCDDFAAKELSPKRDNLLFIGRLGKAKGTVAALEIAKRLGLPLKLAGKIDDNEQDFFESEIKPRLEWPGMEFVGEVNATQKLELYKSAIAVVYPVAFDEPFGLVMAESLASGVPVMAFNRGSVSEILSDGETAVIGNSIEELVARFDEIARIQPQVCIDRARRLFDVSTMVDGYESVYKLVTAEAPVSVR